MENNQLIWPFTHFTDHVWAGVVLILLLIVYIFIFILQLRKNKHILSISMLAGLIVGLYYLWASTELSPTSETNDLTQNYVDGIYMWLTMAWNIFMILLLLVLPIYIFTMVSTTFINSRHLEGGRKLLITSFITLWSMSLLGIIIALSLSPIMFSLKHFMNNDSFFDGVHSDVGVFGGIWPGFEDFLDHLFRMYGLIAVGMVILAIIFAIIMNLLHKYKHNAGEKLINFSLKIRDLTSKYLRGVRYLVPYVISGMIIVLFANYQNAFIQKISDLGLFVLFFFLGLIIVWLIEFGIVLKLRKTKESIPKKEFTKITKEYMKNDFAVQSAPILFPITVAYVKKLGVDKKVSKVTPIFTTFMGYSMCGGFYPALVVIFTLLQHNNGIMDNSLLDSLNVSSIYKILICIAIMIPLILMLTLGMTGVPGIDVAIIIGLLTTLGLDPKFFFTIYLIDPMLDKFRGVGNSMGFAAATVITNKIYENNKNKTTKKDLNKNI